MIQRDTGILYEKRASEMQDVKEREAKRSLGCALALISLLLAGPASAQRQASDSSTGGAPPQSAIVNQFCLGCHNQKLSTAGVSFEGLDPAQVGDHAGIWERALRKVDRKSVVWGKSGDSVGR